MAVVAIILGMLAGFGVITAAPAWADAACDTTETQPAFDFERLLLELEEIGGAAELTIDTVDEDVTCSGENSLAVFYQGDQVSVVDNVADAPNFHLSCSVNYDGRTVEIDGTEYTITDYILASRHVNTGTYHENCEAFPVLVPVTLLKVDEAESPLAGASFLLDGLDGVNDYNCTSGDDGVCDFGDVVPGGYTLSEVSAPEGYEPLTLTAEQASITVSSGATSVELGTFVNTPTPEEPTFNPAISLVKSPVVGEGSDLLDEDPNPLLQFSDSDSDEDAQTALYSYLITNTGDEPLINLSLEDTRIAAGDLDLSACPEVLEVGDSCTATGSETFDLDKAEDEIADGGLVTNTGTVTATGQESEEEVTATDDATIALSIVFPQAPLEKEDPEPAPEVKSDAQEQPAPEVESAAEELPATGLDREGLLPLSLLLMAIGGALLWLDRPWVGVR